MKGNDKVTPFVAWEGGRISWWNQVSLHTVRKKKVELQVAMRGEKIVEEAPLEAGWTSEIWW